MSRTKVAGSVLIIAGALVILSSVAIPTFQDSLSAREQVVFAERLELPKTSQLKAVSNLPVGKVFAKLYVPRFGKKYVHAIAEGTSLSKVLNGVGMGHYVSTQMPGKVGNFAIAAHRAGNGGPFRNIDKFHAGDLAYVETSTTWFTYRYLQTAIVKPSAIGVIYPKPQGLTAVTVSKSFLTLTSCTPIHVNTDRIVAWFELIRQDSKSSGVRPKF
jgi:sortase A